ncbi:MAG: YfhO family protein [Clostridiales bacterium]|nr:YfhO family protein [Clostridiales bacterium]
MELPDALPLPEKRRRFLTLLRENRLLLGSFAIPFVILMVSYFSRGVFPIGNRDVLTIDLYHQYAPFLAEMQARLRSLDGLFYSWSGGLGTNFYALLAYYVASPLNLLLVLFPAGLLTEAIFLIILVKVGLAGASFHYFLREVHREESPVMMAIASSYALSSYVLSYSWNVMWLDGIILLPLVILGLIWIIREQRYLLYPVALGLSLLSNYYIAFFIVLFTAVYALAALFLYQDLPSPWKLTGQLLRIFGLSVLGGTLSAVLTWPTYLSLKLTSAADDAFTGKVSEYFDLFDYISQHFMLMKPTIRDGMPNLYAGLFALAMLPLFFFARQIALKVKYLHLALLLFLITSFNINWLNFAWHGFHYPNQLPYRNSFVYIFLVLSMSYPAWKSRREFTGKQIGAVIATLLVLVLVAQKINDQALPVQALYATLVFLLIYAGVLTLDKAHRIHPSDMAIALLITVVVELTVYALLTMHTIDTTEYLSSREGYTAGTEVRQIREELDRIERSEQDFYRVEVYPPRTTNDGFLYQYRGLSIFASTMSTQPVKFFEKMGYHSNSINSYKYEGSTIVLDSLFGIKYLIRRSNFIHDELREQIATTSELEIYRNPFALPLGYLAPAALKDWTVSNGNPLEAQNEFLQALGGSQDVLIPVNQLTGQQTNIELVPFGTNGYNFNRPSKDQTSRAQILIDHPEARQLYLYLDVTANQPDQGYVLVNDERIDFNAKRSTLVDLGTIPAGARVEFNLTFKAASNATGTFSLYSSALDLPAFAAAIAKINSQSLVLDDFSDSHLRGHVTTQDQGTFLMTIPYDQGWRVKVDGQAVETYAVSNGLLAFDLEAGTHQIDLRFTPPGFWPGLAISLASAFVLLVLAGFNRRKLPVQTESGTGDMV